MTGEDLNGSGRDLIEILSQNLPGRTEEGTDNLRIAGVPDIYTRHLKNRIPLDQPARPCSVACNAGLYGLPPRACIVRDSK